MRKSELIFTSILVPLDFLALLTAGTAAYFFRTSDWMAQYRPVIFYLNLPFGRYFGLVVGAALFLLIIFALIGLYKIKIRRSLLDDFFKILIGVSAGIIVLVFYIFLRREWFDSRFIILVSWGAAVLFVSLARLFIYWWQKYLMKKYNFGTHRVMIIGRDGISKRISEKIQQDPGLGYYLAANLIEPNIEEIKAKVSNPGIEEIILANPDWPKEKVLELVDFCEERYLTFKFVPNLFQTLTSNTSVETLGDIPLIELRKTALDGWGRIIKRVVDFVGAVFGLVALSPFFALVAFIIKWDSSGPILVKLKRISQGKEFNLYKFRSMVDGADDLKKMLWVYNERSDGPLFKIKKDPRVTKIGYYLRRYRIDEFPQLINVLKGEISLIGPRPHQPDEIACYRKRHKKVLAIKSGMTGFAQISGSSDLPFEEEIKLDTYYVEKWSLLMDLKIFLKTFIVLARDRSAC
ncbi:MAG: sugar transferase [Patescibacteria group bacterium]|nr:sugar transferase [Patescibacteria group bacterium]